MSFKSRSNTAFFVSCNLNCMEYNHFEYGELLSRKLKPIVDSADEKRYYTCSESDSLMSLIDRLSSVKGIVLLAMDGRNSDFEYREGDSLLKIPQYFFMMLQPAPNDNSDRILAAQEYCEKICLQIQAYMMHELSHPIKTTPMKCLEPDSFTIRGIGPIGDNLYGAIIGFNLKMGINYELDGDMWMAPSNSPEGGEP